MVKGIGIDLVEVERFGRVQHQRDFLQQILTEEEIGTLPRGPGKAVKLAGMFALKEACLKALGCGLHDGSHWKSMEISRDGEMNVSGALQDIIERTPHSKIFLSRSSSQKYSIAFILIEEQS